jgi:hypothetical protein
MTTCFSRYLMIAALLALFSTASAQPADPADDSVELAEFSVSGGADAIILTWRTSSETDNVGFEVLRTEMQTPYDKEHFKAIGNYLTDSRLEGLGTNSTGKAYSFLDNDPSLNGSSTYCYLIVSLSKTGVRTLHPTKCAVLGIASVDKQSLSAASVVIAPNPIRGELHVSYDLPAATIVSLRVFAIDGSLLLSPMKSELRGAGNHTEVIDVDGLLTGSYTLQVVAVDTTFVEKFVVR